MEPFKSTVLGVSVLVLVGLGAVAAAAPDSIPVEVTGVVFEDLNGNATRDEGEPGIADVRVSDQVEIVATGPDGRFQLQSDGGYGVVYISQPAGYRVSGLFWRRFPETPSNGTLQFPLVRTGEISKFTFLHASDPHLAEETLDRMGLLRDVVAELEPAFVLITGDLIKDALRVGEDEATDLYELLLEELESFTVPVWTTLGNHEIFGIERHHSLVSADHPLYGKQMYRHYLGPDYYSFDFGGVRFIGLDSVDFDDLWYYGNVDPVQLAWLHEELESVDPNTPVVTFNHIPILSAGEMLSGYSEDRVSPSLITVDDDTRYRHTVGNAREVLAELRLHRFTLALAGHFHMRETLFFETDGVKTRFHLTSAVREDRRDVSGLRMISGVTLYSVDKGEIDDGTFIPLESRN